MIDKINELLDTRFSKGDYYRPYDDNDITADSVIEELFEAEASISQYSVDMSMIYENPGCEVYYLSIAFIENGKLEHVVYEMAVC